MYLFRLLVIVLQSSSYLEPWVVDRDNLERHSSRRGGLRRARADRAEVRLRSQGDFFERVARKDPTDLFFRGGVVRDVAPWWRWRVRHSTRES